MNNRDVAHTWANQVKQSATGSHFYFEGQTIYSYGSHFPIACFIRPGVVLFTDRRYSNTTSKHIAYARSALRGDVQIAYVRDPLDGFAGHMRYYRAAIGDIAQSIAATNHTGRIRNLSAEFTTLCAKVATVCEVYGETVPEWAIAPDDIRKRAAELYAVRVKQRQAQIDAAAREYAERVARAESDLNSWVSGERARFPDYAGLCPVRCRVVGDKLETSRGASVRVADIKSAGLWNRIEMARRAKINIDAPEFTIGNYRGLHIDSSGDMKIGCHAFEYGELARVAQLIGEV